MLRSAAGTGRSQPGKRRHRWSCGGCAAVPRLPGWNGGPVQRAGPQDGGPPPAWVEQQTLTLLNRLIQDPESIVPGRTEVKEPAEARRLRRELDEALHSPPVDGERARDMALRLAEHRLNAIGAEEYETTRLQKLFRNHPHMEELERELLHESVRQITYRGKGIQVQLKNGQIMKGGQQP